ncbi:hypothetical protein Q5P01_005628 [Channa striata]|uniref:Uncharacterized protein n=1 Tax=Channa striata TaxID=64152 RepID=A0AA88NHZ7_CHASR|nr:hypothetical protein Q5P01_005628 [Channa striata]
MEGLGGMERGLLTDRGGKGITESLSLSKDNHIQFSRPFGIGSRTTAVFRTLDANEQLHTRARPNNRLTHVWTEGVTSRKSTDQQIPALESLENLRLPTPGCDASRCYHGYRRPSIIYDKMPRRVTTALATENDPRDLSVFVVPGSAQ